MTNAYVLIGDHSYCLPQFLRISHKSHHLGNRKGKYTKRLEKEKQSERELKALKLKERMSIEQAKYQAAGKSTLYY